VSSACGDEVTRPESGVSKHQPPPLPNKTRFDKAGVTQFGSGRVCLARKKQDGGRFRVFITAGHNNFLIQGRFLPLLNDARERACYLKHGAPARRLVEWLVAGREFARGRAPL
jgi:hypothetical protein